MRFVNNSYNRMISRNNSECTSHFNHWIWSLISSHLVSSMMTMAETRGGCIAWRRDTSNCTSDCQRIFRDQWPQSAVASCVKNNFYLLFLSYSTNISLSHLSSSFLHLLLRMVQPPPVHYPSWNTNHLQLVSFHLISHQKILIKTEIYLLMSEFIIGDHECLWCIDDDSECSRNGISIGKNRWLQFLHRLETEINTHSLMFLKFFKVIDKINKNSEEN